MITNALLVALVMFFVKLSEIGAGNPMLTRPLVVGPLVGLVLGDLPSGIVLGSSLELIFLGTVIVGGAVPTDATVGSLFGTAFAILLGKGTDVALALAVPIGLFSVLVFQGWMFVGAALMKKIDQYAAEGNENAIVRMHFGLMFSLPAIYAVITFVTIYFGADTIGVVINAVPKFIMDSLTVAGNLLPALGFAILINMLWTKELAAFLFLGFVLATYLKLPIIAIAILGAVVSIVIAYRDSDLQQRLAKVTTSAEINSEEDDFFNE